jgi:hypothetical protein
MKRITDNLDNDLDLDPEPEEDESDPEPKEKKSHHRPKTKAKNKYESDFDKLADDDEILDEETLFDQEEEVAKPPWTGYNSREGYILTDGYKKKRYHGDQIKGKDGKSFTLECPKLDYRGWANKFEEFEQFHLEPNDQLDTEGKPEFDFIGETKPAKLNKLDNKFMECCAKYKRLLFLAHRNFHKSVNLTRWAKICAADFGDTILYAGATSEEAVKFTQALRDEFMFNETFKQHYGYIIDDKRGNQKNKMYWLSQRFGEHREKTRSPGCTTMTPKNHRTGAHPKRIFVDDVVPEEVLEHPKLIEFIRNWFFKSLLPMCRADSQIVMVGTIKDPQDLYSEIISEKGHKGFHIEIVKAIEIWPNDNQQDACQNTEPNRWKYIYNSEGVVSGVADLIGGRVGNDEFRMDNWQLPSRVKYYVNNDIKLGLDYNRMAMQEFLIERKVIGRSAFETEYQLNPTSVTKGYLRLDNIQYYDYGEKGIPTLYELGENTFAMFDQAYGRGNTADYSCISVVAAVQRPNVDLWNYYIRDVFIWRGGGVNKKIQMIQAVKAMYPEIKSFGVEAGQSNTNDLLEIQDQLNTDVFNVVPVYQNKPPKPKDPNGVDTKQQSLNLDMSGVITEKKAKVRRIVNQWDSKLELGQVFWRRGIGSQTTDDMEINVDSEADINPIKELHNEEAFPKCKHFDLLDSIGSCFDLCETKGVDDFYALYGSANMYI